MSNFNQNKIIKSLDNPSTLMNISLGDLLLLAFPSIAALLITSSIIATLLTLVGMFVVKKFTKKLPRRYFARWVYWNFPTRTLNAFQGTLFAPSHVDIWIRR